MSNNQIYYAFNAAYQSYLNNISMSVFMEAFLNKIINITQSNYYYLGDIDNIIYTNISDIVILKIYKNLALKVYNCGVICNYNDYVCIPCKFNNKIVCVLGIYNNDKELLEIIGQLVGVLYNNSNKVTENKTNKECLLYRYIDELLDDCPIGKVITGNSFEIIYINKLAKNIFDSIRVIDKKQIISNYIGNLFTDIIEINDYFVNGYTNLKKNIGNTIYLNISINKVSSSDNNYYIISIHDETKDIFNNDSNFMAYLSHELRNPLQAITLSSYLLENNINSSQITINPKIKMHLNTISKSGNDMKRIINDILDLFKLESKPDDFIMEFNVHNISELVENIYNMYSHVAAEKGLVFEYKLSDNLPKTLYMDDVRVTQILSNLVSNAIKYTNTGYVRIFVEYNSVNNGGIYFGVIDSGMGIKDDEMCYLFRQFGKTNNSFKFNIKNNSNGLGLYLSQKIACLHGGKINIEKNKEVCGSVFTLYLPIKLGTSWNSFQKLCYENVIEGNILVVDDDEVNLSLFKSLLENMNTVYSYKLNIDILSDGKSAISATKNKKYDIIFMDINMEELDGIETSKIIKSSEYFTGHIIATTGNILIKDKCNVFSDILIKPYDEKQVLNMLFTFLTKL